MRSTISLMIAAFGLAMVPIGVAGADCPSGSVTTIDGGVATLYYVEDPYYGPTLYLESNGEPGLQACGSENPDMKVF